MIPALLALGWQAWNSIKDIQATLEGVDAKIDSHSDQLKAIWERLRKP